MNKIIFIELAGPGENDVVAEAVMIREDMKISLNNVITWENNVNDRICLL